VNVIEINVKFNIIKQVIVVVTYLCLSVSHSYIVWLRHYVTIIKVIGTCS
jgi:hypothetical protein